jgi:hypothetical protein
MRTRGRGRRPEVGGREEVGDRHKDRHEVEGTDYHRELG